MSYETFTAFALEASFFGVLLFGRSRVPPWFYLLSTAMVALGTTLLKALAILEFPAFPARDLSTELGVRLLGELAQSDELSSLPAFAPERLATTARLFLDLVAVPMLLRALFEVNLKVLDAEIDAHVARSVLPRSVAKTAA